MAKRRKAKRSRAVALWLATIAAQRLVIVALAAGVAYSLGRQSSTDLAISAASLTLSAARYCLN